MLGGESREDELIAINSFDGAVNDFSEKKQLNVSMYNASFLSYSALRKGLFPVNTSLTFTWKQVIGDDDVSNIFLVMKDMHKWLGEGISMNSLKGRKLSVYEVHYCTMIYSLTQYSA